MAFHNDVCLAILVDLVLLAVFIAAVCVREFPPPVDLTKYPPTFEQWIFTTKNEVCKMLLVFMLIVWTGASIVHLRFGFMLGGWLVWFVFRRLEKYYRKQKANIGVV